MSIRSLFYHAGQMQMRGLSSLKVARTAGFHTTSNFSCILNYTQPPHEFIHFQGEIPRHMQLFCDRSLCERVVPGNRVLIHGIFSIRKVGKPGKGDSREKAIVGVRAPYMRIVGIVCDTQGVGAISRYNSISSEEEETFRRLSSSANVYDRIADSLAPSIFGSADIKKAIACLLFGGKFFYPVVIVIMYFSQIIFVTITIAGQ